MPRLIYITLVALSLVSLAAFAALLYQKPPREVVPETLAIATSSSHGEARAAAPARGTLPAHVVPRTAASETARSIPDSTENTPRAVATITIEGPADTQVYDIPRAGDSLIETMRSLADKGFVFTVREYPGMGAFIESIGGAKNADGYYWILWVNGTKAAAGASSIIVHEGDHFRWTYEQGY